MLFSFVYLRFYRVSKNWQEIYVFKLPYNCPSSFYGHVLTGPNGSPQGNAVLNCRTQKFLQTAHCEQWRFPGEYVFKTSVQQKDCFKVLPTNHFSTHVFAFLLDTLSQAILAGWVPLKLNARPFPSWCCCSFWAWFRICRRQWSLAGILTILFLLRYCIFFPLRLCD